MNTNATEYRCYGQQTPIFVQHTLHLTLSVCCQWYAKEQDGFVDSFDVYIHKIYEHEHVTFKMWKLKSLVEWHSSVSAAFIFGGHNLNLFCYQFE